MKLAQSIIENERTNQTEKNNQLVRIKLKELVYAYPNEVLRVLHKTGIPVSTLVSSPVLYATVLNNLKSNPGLRESISKMILELDGYASADGQKWQLAGNIVSALGTVLSGIGRSQTTQDQPSLAKEEKDALEKQAEEEKTKSTRRMWLTIGIALVVITAIIVAFKVYGKKTAPVNAPKPFVQPKIQLT